MALEVVLNHFTNSKSVKNKFCPNIEALKLDVNLVAFTIKSFTNTFSGASRISTCNRTS